VEEQREGATGTVRGAADGGHPHVSPGRRSGFLVPAAVFIALAVMAAVVGVLVYGRQAQVVRERSGKELTAVRVLKAAELAEWQGDQLNDANLLAADPVLGGSLERWLDEGRPLPAPALVRSLVSTYRAMHGFARITVLDPDLHTVYSSPSGLPRLGRHTRTLARRAMDEDRVVFSDFFVDGRGNIALEYLAPVRGGTSSGAAVLGAYVLRVDPEDYVFPLLSGWPTRVDAGATLLVERRGSDVLYLSPSHLQGGAALTVDRLAATSRLAGALAVRGAVGVVDAVDYNGTPVLASIGPVAGTPWYLVARLDAPQLSAQLRGSALATFAVVVGVILVGGLLLMLFWGRRESRQMRLLYAAESDLRASEEHFRVVFEDAPLGISLAQPDGRLGQANEAFARMLGFKRDELSGLTVAELTHPEDRHDTEVLMKACLDGEREGFTLEKRYLRQDGGAVWTTASVVLLRHADGSPDHFVAMIEDVTTRRADALRLARLSRLYRVLVAVNEAIVRAPDRDTLYAEVCRVLVELGGYAGAWVAALDDGGAECAVAAAGLERIPVDATGVEQPHGAGVSDGGRLSPVGVALRQGRTDACGDVQRDQRTAAWHDTFIAQGIRSAAAIPVLVRGEAVAAVTVYAVERDAFGLEELELFEQLAADLAYAVESFHVDEARAHAERGLAQLNRELEQRVLERTVELRASNRELEAFSYSVSHDLRAPLRALDGFSLALMEDYHDALDDTARDYLNRVRAASQRMGHLIDDLLTLSRVTRRELVREDVDLAALGREVVAELREAEPGRHVEVTLPDELHVQGDSALLRVVVGNLLGNSWKFTSRRDVAHIEFGEVAGGVEAGGADRVAYFVRDDGAGFEQAYADKLFAPFQRLHSAEEFPGTGIGLATAERIVHRHGGSMWARGAVDSGATFYFTLQ
jgi:PAS domain S-box-containing protein